MNIVIIEDEFTARESLKFLLQKIDSNIQILGEADSISSGVELFSSASNIDLALFDIQLSDGISFEIFKQVSIKIPIIFTTAYDEFAIEAFKVNSVDYLLKPIKEENLRIAIKKFKSIYQQNTFDISKIEKVIQQLNPQKDYKKSFLIEYRDSLIPIKTSDFAFFMLENENVKGTTIKGQTYFVNYNLDEIISQVDPFLFYRANRQCIVNRNSIESISMYFNGRLIIHTQPKAEDPIIVSKAKASDFKNWIK